MWLSRKLSAYRAAQQEGTAADMGVTTIGGGSASVMTRGEQRDLEVFAPGGLVWQPRVGDTVLVIKGGVGCQEHCVVAAETAGAAPEEQEVLLNGLHGFIQNTDEDLDWNQIASFYQTANRDVPGYVQEHLNK